MSHVEDRWTKVGPAGRRIKSERHGQGRRWLAIWTEAGVRRKRSFDAKESAAGFLARVAVQQLEGTYVTVEAGNVTLQAFSARWLAEQIHQQPATRSITERMWRLHILPQLGQCTLGELTRARIQAAVPIWSEDLAAASVKLLWTYLSAAMTAAVGDRLILANPCQGVKLPPVHRARVVPLTPQQVHQLAQDATEAHRALVLTIAATGLRQGEAIALTIDRLKITSRSVTITVDRQMLDSVPTFGPLKTPTSYRTISEGPELAKILRRHIADHPPHPSGLIFTTASGEPLTRQRMGWIWQAIRGATIPAGTSGWHLLRHHHASMLISAGLSPVAVAARLGHTVQECLKTYAHLWPTDESRIREAVAENFWAVQPPQSPQLRVVGESVQVTEP